MSTQARENKILDRRRLFFLVDVIFIFIFLLIQIFYYYKYGITSWKTNDGAGYVALADELRSGTIWTSIPDLHTNYLPLSLLRLPGYSLVILLAQTLAGAWWEQAIVFAQLLAAFSAAAILYRCFSIISMSRIAGFAAVLVFLISSRDQFDRWILTDSFYTSGLTVLICLAVWAIHTRHPPNDIEMISAGTLLAVLLLFREMTVILAAAAFPLAFLVTQGSKAPISTRLGKLVLFFAPLAFAVLTILGWNYARTGYLVLTTGAQTASIYALAEVEKHGTPIFTRDDPLDKEARKTLKTYDFTESTLIGSGLFHDYGLTSPEIANIGSRRFLQEWYRHPTVMFDSLKRNLDGWPLLFMSQDAWTAVNSWRNDYVNYIRKLFFFCILYLPAGWTLIAIAAFCLAKAQRRFFVVSALWILSVLPSLAYGTIHFEVRYALYSESCLLLILALTIGAAAELMGTTPDILRRLLALLARRLSPRDIRRDG